MDEANRETARQLRQVQEDYKKVFLHSPHGKRVLKDLMAYSGVVDASFNRDPVTMAFREGQRDVAIKILTALDKRSYQGLVQLERAGAGLTDVIDPEVS